MAVITSQERGPLDTLEMAIGSYLAPDVEVVSSAEMRMIYNTGFTVKLTGSDFSFDADQDIYTGFISSISEIYLDIPNTLIKDISINISEIIDLINSGEFGSIVERILSEHDNIIGTQDGDRIYGYGGDDVVWGYDGDDEIDGGQGDDVAYGGSGRDVVFGGYGNDLLDGGAGGDWLAGGIGDDVYVVDDVADVVVEVLGEGVDQVRISAETFALPNDVEQLVYVGSERVVAYGNASDNSMAGSGKTDFLSGFDGNDLLNGWAGDDVIYGGNGDDIIIGGSGADTLYGGLGIDTLVLAGTAADYTVAKSGDAYLITGGSTDTVSGFEKVLVGTQTINFNVFVDQALDGLRYIASYPDLIKSFGASAAAGKAHYLEDGQRQDRSLSLFDSLVYAASNPDVFRAFGEDRQMLTRHYIENGFAEGRNASSFDPIIYAASNLDVARAFGYDREALTLHYLEEGLRQGRDAYSFDALRYAASNPDVAKAFGADRGALTRHWIDTGSVEGRSATNFDPRQYAASNPDVAQAWGTDLTSITVHYIQEGIVQGRVTSGFDAVAYLLSYDDLGAARLGAAGAFEHWLSDGIAQDRAGDSLFGREQANHELTTVGLTDTLDQAGDQDWFQFAVSQDSQVQISFASDSSNGLLEVHRSDGRFVGTSVQGTGNEQILTFTADLSDSYYLVVQGQDYSMGSYALDLVWM